MDQLDPKTDGVSLDILADNIGKLRQAFPEVFAEDRVDFDTLRDVLGDYVEDRQERYSFTWHGKSTARRIAQTPSSGTLRPCPEESVDWDTTRNLFIEGDNLEVLKLLQKSYYGRVKMIYIDPPYNTGNEFIYPDKYQDNLDTYLRYTGQVDAGGLRLSANADTSGRYHTNWLNMMYPRLKLARNLLSEQGVIFMSIGNEELANLKKLGDEVFGEENSCGVLIWEKKKKPSFLDANMGTVTDYILCFAKNRAQSPPFVAGAVEDGKKYPFNNAGNGIQTLLFPAGSVSFKCVDQRIPAQDMSAGNIKTELLDDVEVVGGRNVNAFRLRGEWRYSQAKLDGFIEDHAEIVISGVPFRPNYVNRSGQPKKTANLLSYRTNGVPTNEDATDELRRLFGTDVMSYPKPSGLLSYLVGAVTSEDDLVMDFFAGSATTGHGVWLQNLADGGHRRFILVQLPEPLDPEQEPGKTAYTFCTENGLEPTISAIGVERLRRVGRELASPAGAGFRVFKLASSNMKDWDPTAGDVALALVDSVESVKPERSGADVLSEILLKYGLDLAMPFREIDMCGQPALVSEGGALLLLLGESIDDETARAVVGLRDELRPEMMRVVVRDAGFNDDVAKTNFVEILRHAGIDDVKSM